MGAVHSTAGPGAPQILCGDFRGTVHDCRVVLTEREGAGEVAICASDHYGVCADVQIAATA